MLRRTLLLALLLPFAFAAPFDERAEQVLVPGRGYVNKADVHEVPAGASISQVGDEVRLLSSTGRILHSSKVDPTARISRVQEKRALSGWIVAGHWTNSGSSAIRTFTTRWTVSSLSILIISVRRLLTFLPR